MEIFESIIDFFGIEILDSTATFVDLCNLWIQVFVGVFIICFFFRSIFLIISLPEREDW